MVGRGPEDRRAEFERVALPHLDQVYTSALYLARDPDRASDLTQETFLRAFRFFHQFASGTNCRAWLL
ncbi:MAG: sigma factor, partial [Candidatus Binatia bacterium]